MEQRFEHSFSRTELLVGVQAMERLYRARVAVFGLGGVGGYAVEALARAGIGHLELIDRDTVSLTNLNRQILATVENLGRYKAEVAKERVLAINPNAEVTSRVLFYTPETAGQFDFSKYDYVVDAIDTVTGKLALAEQASKSGTPLISAMGAGNKLGKEPFLVSDISKTSVCPLARIMRKELRKRGINHLKVVYSQEEPIAVSGAPDPETGKITPGSMPHVPGMAGLILAGEVIRDLLFEGEAS